MKTHRKNNFHFLFPIFLVLVVLSGLGCKEECKTNADCSAGKLCVNGKCRAKGDPIPPIDSGPDADTDTDTDGDGDIDSGPDTDTDTDTDTGTDEDAGIDAGVDAGTPICDGDCEAGVYSACTCGIDDPCGWSNNGSCDHDCLNVPGVSQMFDDNKDCPNDNCEGHCGAGFYDACTCNPADFCQRAENGTCDSPCLKGGWVTEMYDDSVDCGGPCAGQCGNQFGVGIEYTQCTCDGVNDPCGWIGDCICQAGPGRCEGVLDTTFPDKEDCPCQ